MLSLKLLTEDPSLTLLDSDGGWHFSVFLAYTCITPTATSIFTQTSFLHVIINSESTKSNVLNHQNQVWVRLCVWSTLGQNFSPSVYLRNLRKMLSASKMQWWGKHKVGILILNVLNWKENMSQASLKCRKENSIRFQCLRIISVIICSVF